MQVIYVDVLLCINLFINYFLLLATAKILGCEVRRLRLLFGAFSGAVFALSIFLPDMGILVFPLRLLISGIIIFCTLGYKGKRLFFKQIAMFFCISFLFAGIMFVLLSAFPKSGGRVSNSVVYLNLSPIMLIFSTLICYLSVRIISHFTKTSINGTQKEAALTVEVFNKQVNLRGLCDTGNLIEETFSGYPVIIADYRIIKQIIPFDVLPFFEKGEAITSYKWNKILRVVPCDTISGEAFLKCFRPERVTVKTGNRTSVLKNVYIGVSFQKISGGEFDAVINPNIAEISAEKIFLRERKTL